MLTRLKNHPAATAPPVGPSMAERITPWIFYTAALAIMWGLKHHYSLAGPDELDWILGPTAKLVAWLDGMPYTRAAGIGHIRGDQRIIIAPACAGVNFMIMAFGITALTGLRHRHRFHTRIAWLLAMLPGAYIATVGVNTLRIIVSILLYDGGVAMGWLTPERIHRVVGIGIYFGFLWLYYTGLKPIMGADRTGAWPNRRTAMAWIPLGGYLLGTLGVPLAHRLCRGRPLPDAEHCITVVLVSGLLCAMVAAGRRVLRARTNRNRGRAEQHRPAIPH